jgi:hypothetical protein
LHEAVKEKSQKDKGNIGKPLESKYPSLLQGRKTAGAPQ